MTTTSIVPNQNLKIKSRGTVNSSINRANNKGNLPTYIVLSMGYNLSMGYYYFASTETVAKFVCIPSHYTAKLPNLN